MKKWIIIFGLAIFAIVAVCGISFLLDKTWYTDWKIENNSANRENISWTKFEWNNGELNGKYFEKLSMNIPCKVDGLPNPCTFQFDLGAGETSVYEHTFSSLYTLNPELTHTIKRLRSKLQFWNNRRYFEGLSLHFGNYTATNKMAAIDNNYGEKIENATISDTLHLGTVGADLFKDKVLIIDYPNTQFAICDSIPRGYADNLINIELDQYNRVILPMKMHNKNYRVTFDNGSSIFPLITLVKNISNYSTSADIDSIQISSWGQQHIVTGKLITDSFELAGQKFCNVKIYANHSGLGTDHHTDATAGNTLFWNNTIIIDFKNKRFGVK